MMKNDCIAIVRAISVEADTSAVAAAVNHVFVHLNSIQFSFIYKASNHNNSPLMVLYVEESLPYIAR